MSVILKINPEKRVVHSTFFGLVTDQELLRHGETIVSHSEFRSDDEVLDFTMVTDLKITAATMQKLAARQSVFHRSAKHVIIAPKDFSFEKAEEFKRIAEANRPTLRVVRKAAEAYEIIGLK